MSLRVVSKTSKQANLKMAFYQHIEALNGFAHFGDVLSKKDTAVT